jgi:hypothetical protein
MPSRKFDEIAALQKRPNADDNEPPTGTQSGLGHFPQRIGGRGVDDDVG